MPGADARAFDLPHKIITIAFEIPISTCTANIAFLPQADLVAMVIVDA
jgi:hypothetical protein